MEKERQHNEITKLFVRVNLRTLALALSSPNLFKGPEVVCTENVQNVIKAILYFETELLK
jgi:hypothetical protein